MHCGLLRIMLGAASITVLMSVAALADDNFSNVLQSGNNNDGLVTQGGADNRVGTLGSPARQSGDSNSFDFTQSGIGNAIGGGGSGFLQSSNRNGAMITQSSDGNKVQSVTQTGIVGGSIPANTLTVTQSGGDGNNVATVVQMRFGIEAPVAPVPPIRADYSSVFAYGLAVIAYNAARLTYDNVALPAFNIVNAFNLAETGNVATVNQSGGTNAISSLGQNGARHLTQVTQSSDGNLVGIIDQRGLAQTAIVQQSVGDGNVLNLLHQEGLGNSATVTLTGADNGTSAWPSSHPLLDAVFVGRGLAAVYQNGIDNVLSLGVTGASNEYHFEQNGAALMASGLLTGDWNAGAVVQADIGSTASYTATGDDNHIYIGQTGLDQDATIVISGNDNHAAVVQAGASQVTSLDIKGSNNLLATDQSGFGNSLILTISGSDNNSAGFTPNLPAHTTATRNTPALVPGQIIQSGLSNTINYSVGNLYTSDNNKFAFLQDGNGNSITGSTNGNLNEVAIMQQGSLNQAWFRQNGIGNVIGVSQ